MNWALGVEIVPLIRHLTMMRYAILVMRYPG